MEEGHLLARLDDREARVHLQKAQAQADSDGAALRRAQDLATRGLISDEEFEKLALAHRLAEAQVREAELLVSQKEVRAPFAGVVTVRDCRVGEQVIPNQHLFTVADFDPLLAVVHLPEQRVASLTVATKWRRCRRPPMDERRPRECPPSLRGSARWWTRRRER